jgi:hypothetical protein
MHIDDDEEVLFVENVVRTTSWSSSSHCRAALSGSKSHELHDLCQRAGDLDFFSYLFTHTCRFILGIYGSTSIWWNCTSRVRRGVPRSGNSLRTINGLVSVLRGLNDTKQRQNLKWSPYCAS